MTLPPEEQEVGVRALHDRLSEYLETVESGAEIVVTRRGKRVARLTAVDRDDPLRDLERRGLIRVAQRSRKPRRAKVKADGGVSHLVNDQRR